ncbi:MAG: tetratricopeptide repeat protein, partial [Blastocatellia bacterium]
MIRQATQPDTEIAPGPEFDNLLRIGELAAEEVWRQHQALAQTPDKRRWRQWFTFRQPALRWAAAAVLLLAVIIPVYRFYRSNQPIERAMESLRQTWSQSRPLEGRVTGGFPYLPYQVTRGGDDLAPVNQNQLTAATAELAREVIDRPSPRAWHAMGRLHLLKGEFERAEELLKQALDAEPRNAQAHVDLALSLYERGVREESLPLLSQAAGHLKTATEIEPRLAEAWFNLALCHEQMMLLSQAQTDWERFLELDGSSPWAGEARARLQKLRGRSRLVTPESSTVADELLAAEAAGDEAKIRQLLAEKFSEVTTVAWGRFLDEYLKAIGAGNQSEASKYRRILQRLAELIRDGKNDHYYVDQFAFVSRSDTARLNQIRQLR